VSLHIALLRGVNVGGRNRLAMADLRSALTGAGVCGVRSYLQSGNVVLEAPSEHEAVALVREAALACGVDADVVARSGAEFRQVVADSPFPGADPKRLHLVALDREPTTPDADRFLAHADPLPELVQLRGRHLYVDYRDGVAGSRLQLGRLGQVTATARNWRTVTALASML
jgi:uncharacterized protein (DUF1697 family)